MDVINFNQNKPLFPSIAMESDDEWRCARKRRRRRKASVTKNLGAKGRQSHPQSKPRRRCQAAKVTKVKFRKGLFPKRTSQPSLAFARALADPGAVFSVGSACAGWCAESQALTKLGIPHHVTFLCDNNRHVKKFLHDNLVFSRYYDSVFNQEFVREQTVDLFCAGFPCQPYSTEGKRLASQDPRSNVIKPILSYIEKQKPPALILENVPSWLTAESGQCFEETKKRLQDIEGEEGRPYYNFYHCVLDTADFGTPQARKRVYVVALAAAVDQGFQWPRPFAGGHFNELLDKGSSGSVSVSLKEMMGKIQDSCIKTKTNVNNIARSFHRLAKSSDVMQEHVVVDVGTGRGTRCSVGHFPTLTATRCKSRDYVSLNMGRRFTLAELARAQGAFADGLRMDGIPASEMGHIIGNAMSVNIMTVLIERVVQAFGLR